MSERWVATDTPRADVYATAEDAATLARSARQHLRKARRNPPSGSGSEVLTEVADAFHTLDRLKLVLPTSSLRVHLEKAILHLRAGERSAARELIQRARSESLSVHFVSDGFDQLAGALRNAEGLLSLGKNVSARRQVEYALPLVLYSDVERLIRRTEMHLLRCQQAASAGKSREVVSHLKAAEYLISIVYSRALLWDARYRTEQAIGVIESGRRIGKAQKALRRAEADLRSVPSSIMAEFKPMLNECHQDIMNVYNTAKTDTYVAQKLLLALLVKLDSLSQRIR